jgi:SH3-like domain-containing protein
VGEAFEFLFSIEAPKDVTIDQIRISPSDMFGMNLITGSISQLADAASANPSNVVHRYSTQVRYDVPFRGRIQFQVQGNASGTMSLGDGRMRSSFSYSQSFRLVTGNVALDIQPLPSAGQPPDFSGAVGTGFRLTQSVNRNMVATNDVVVVTCRLVYSGYVPPDFAAARDVVERSDGAIAWRRYFVADGAAATPVERVVYYDADAKAYRTLTAGGTALGYVAETHGESVAVAVDAAAAGSGRVLRLRFAPSSSAPLVATVPRPDAMPAPTEEPRGEWVRVEAGGHAGWIRKEEMRNEN